MQGQTARKCECKGKRNHRRATKAPQTGPNSKKTGQTTRKTSNQCAGSVVIQVNVHENRVKYQGKHAQTKNKPKGQTPNKTHNRCGSMSRKRTINAYTKRGRASQNVRNRTKHQGKLNPRINANQSVAMQVKSSGVVSKSTQTGSNAKENLHAMHKQPRSGHPISPKTEKANRQHVGKSLGTDGADVVTPKADARDRGIDLKREAKKGRCEHGYRGETSSKSRNQCGDG